MQTTDPSRDSLCELFVERGLISEADLELARVEEAATNRRLTDILVRRGLVTGHDITSALMEQLNRFDARPTAMERVNSEPADPVEAAPEPKPELMLLQGDSSGEAAAVSSPVEELSPAPPAEIAAADLEPAPGTTEPGSVGGTDEPEFTPFPATDDPSRRLESVAHESPQPQTLIREADARRHAAEAELAALGQVWQGLEQIQVELHDHNLSTPSLLHELNATQARLRTRENELSAEITLWESAREEVGRAADELEELRRELSEKVHELSETQAEAATWSARVADLEAEIAEITRRATVAAHVLEVFATSHHCRADHRDSSRERSSVRTRLAP